MNRRSLLLGLSGLIAAPAVLRLGAHMPVRRVEEPFWRNVRSVARWDPYWQGWEVRTPTGYVRYGFQSGMESSMFRIMPGSPVLRT